MRPRPFCDDLLAICLIPALPRFLTWARGEWSPSTWARDQVPPARSGEWPEVVRRYVSAAQGSAILRQNAQSLCLVRLRFVVQDCPLTSIPVASFDALVRRLASLPLESLQTTYMGAVYALPYIL